MVNYLALHFLCPGKCSASNSSSVHHDCRAIEQSFATPWIARVNTSHFSVWFSLRSPAQLTSPTTIAGYFLLLCVSLTWSCWESFLLLLRGDKPISKAGACRGAYLHLSSAGQSIHGADVVAKGWPRDGHNQCQPVLHLPELTFPCFLFPKSCSPSLLNYA